MMETSVDIEKICKLGKIARWVLWFICGMILLSNISLFLFYGVDTQLFTRSTPFMIQELFLNSFTEHPSPFDIHDSPKLLTKLTWYVTVTACFIITIAILVKLDRLFKSYSKGIVFHSNNIKNIATIGWLLIALYFADAIASMTFESLLFSLPHGPFTVFEGEMLGSVFVESIEESDIEMLDCFPPEVIGSGIEQTEPLEFGTIIYNNATLLLFGSFLVVVARIMSYAGNLKKEVDTLI